MFFTQSLQETILALLSSCYPFLAFLLKAVSLACGSRVNHNFIAVERFFRYT